MATNGQFSHQEIFRGNVSEAIPLVETDVTFNVTSISANEVASFRFSPKISSRGNCAKFRIAWEIPTTFCQYIRKMERFNCN